MAESQDVDNGTERPPPAPPHRPFDGEYLLGMSPAKERGSNDPVQQERESSIQRTNNAANSGTQDATMTDHDMERKPAAMDPNRSAEASTAPPKVDDRCIGFKVRFQLKAKGKQTRTLNIANVHQTFIQRFIETAPGATIFPSKMDTIPMPPPFSSIGNFPADGDSH